MSGTCVAKGTVTRGKGPAILGAKTMKHSILFVLSTLSLMATATGCAAPTEDEPAKESTASQSSAITDALSLAKTSGTCSLDGAVSLTFGGATATGGQVYVFHTNQINPETGVGAQGCTSWLH